MAQRDSSGLEAERQRLNEANAGAKDWRRWGPYVSECQWAPVSWTESSCPASAFRSAQE
jgi:hypothetical protein